MDRDSKTALLIVPKIVQLSTIAILMHGNMTQYYHRIDIKDNIFDAIN